MRLGGRAEPRFYGGATCFCSASGGRQEEARLRRTCRALRLMLEETLQRPDHSAAFLLAEVERFVREQLAQFPKLRSALEQRRKRSGARR